MKAPKPWESMNNTTSSNALLNTLQRQQSGLEAPHLDPVTANKITQEKEVLAETKAVLEGKDSTTANPLTSTESSGLGGLRSGLGSSGLGLGGMGYGGLGMGMGMGGLGMGMGGLGMYGRAGMMGGEDSSFFRAMQFMESMSFVVSSMCQVVSMLDQNAEGMIHLWASLKNLVKRSIDWFVGGCAYMKLAFYQSVFKALVFLRLEKDEAQTEEINPQFEGKEEMTEHIRALREVQRKKKIYKALMKALIGVIAACLIYFYWRGRRVFFKKPVAADHLAQAFDSVK